jgi:hypothetical protein
MEKGLDQQLVGNGAVDSQHVWREVRNVAQKATPPQVRAFAFGNPTC